MEDLTVCLNCSVVVIQSRQRSSGAFRRITNNADINENTLHHWHKMSARALASLKAFVCFIDRLCLVCFVVIPLFGSAPWKARGQPWPASLVAYVNLLY